jgi:hypothetical protein
VKIVVDIVAEEILRQMREMQEAAEEEKATARPVSTSSAKNKQKPEVTHGRDRI